MGTFRVRRARSVSIIELIKFLRNLRDAVGQIPSQDQSYTLATKDYPNNEVRREDVREAHRVVFPSSKPGPRVPRLGL